MTAATSTQSTHRVRLQHGRSGEQFVAEYKRRESGGGLVMTITGICGPLSYRDDTALSDYNMVADDADWANDQEWRALPNYEWAPFLSRTQYEHPPAARELDLYADNTIQLPIVVAFESHLRDEGRKRVYETATGRYGYQFTEAEMRMFEAGWRLQKKAK